jgi:fibro-slime domain-containing protein
VKLGASALAIVALGCSAGPTDPAGVTAGTTGSAGSTSTPGGGASAGSGTGSAGKGNGGGFQLGDAGAGPQTCGSVLRGTVRDFKEAHPDFEGLEEIGKCYCEDRGMVATTLGEDKKPVYVGNPTTGTPSTTGKANFDQWFRDVPGTNMAIVKELKFELQADGKYTYQDSSFFPIDKEGFGNENRFANFHFTFELHTEFIYRGGETFEFRGDDDVFTYINGQLVVDLGGIHDVQTATVNLDMEAARLGLVVGNVYPLDFFFAERHCCASNFRIDTTLSFVSCGEPE